jgi:uncharacterized Fe-S center protein
MLHFPDGKTVKNFNIITPAADADILIDLCKLKTHSVTKMSAAAKNLFGTIPGIEKFEMHARYPDYSDFSSMLCDLCRMHCESKEVIAIIDAVIGMEGNGPTAGKPRKIGCIISSLNPFAADLLAEKIIGFDGMCTTVKEAIKRGYCPENADMLKIAGDPVDKFIIKNFQPTDADKQPGKILHYFSSGKIGKLLSPRPVVDKNLCRGCGECKNSCPQKTIIIIEKGKKFAQINYDNCIKCYCCQELCPFEAIKIKRNPLIGIITKIN